MQTIAMDETIERIWDRLTVSGHLVWNDVEGDLVLFDPGPGEYLALDTVASVIWRAIAHSEKLDGLLNHLQRLYDAPRNQISRDTHRFVLGAIENGLLELKNC